MGLAHVAHTEGCPGPHDLGIYSSPMECLGRASEVLAGGRAGKGNDTPADERRLTGRVWRVLKWWDLPKTPFD